MNDASLTRTSRKRYLIRGIVPRVLLCSICNDFGVISLFQRGRNAHSSSYKAGENAV
jgi:hypothetical protein